MTTASRTSAPAPAPATTYVVATTEKPIVVCPEWCDETQEWHLSELENWEGRVIHTSAVRHLGAGVTATLSSTTTVDGAVEEPVNIHIHEHANEMSPAEALTAGRALAALAEEVL